MMPADREEKRQHILKAALAVFAKRGFGQATIADIASHAGIAKGVVYDYFPSKEDLFADLFEYLFPRDENAFRRFVSRASDPLEAIERGAAAIMARYESLGEYFNVIAQFWARGQSEGVCERFAAAWRNVYSYCRQSMATFIRQGMDAGMLRSDLDVDMSAWAVVAVIDGSILQWMHSRANHSLIESGISAVRLLLRAMAVDPVAMDAREPFVFLDLSPTDRSVNGWSLPGSQP